MAFARFGIQTRSECETRLKFLLLSFTTAFLVMLFTQRVQSPSMFTFALSVVFSFVTVLQSEICLRAFERGPVSYTVVIISLSALIPTLSGAVFWHENITLTQGIGIAFLVISLILSVSRQKATDETGGAAFSKKGWLMLCLAGFLLSGLVGVLQKVHQSSVYKQELPAFMLISFGLSWIYSVICYAVFRLKNRKRGKAIEASAADTVLRSFLGRTEIMPSLLALIAGTGVALNNVINLYLSGVMESAVFFPIVNVGGLVLTTVTSVLLFRERLTVRQWVGIAAGVISVLMLCDPFR